MTGVEIGEAIAGLIGLGMGIGAVLRGSPPVREPPALPPGPSTPATCACCAELERKVDAQAEVIMELRLGLGLIEGKIDEQAARRRSRGRNSIP